MEKGASMVMLIVIIFIYFLINEAYHKIIILHYSECCGILLFWNWRL